MTGLLEGKNAIIYGGGGNIGSAVARTFAQQGARVSLRGRASAIHFEREPYTKETRWCP